CPLGAGPRRIAPTKSQAAPSRDNCPCFPAVQPPAQAAPPPTGRAQNCCASRRQARLLDQNAQRPRRLRRAPLCRHRPRQEAQTHQVHWRRHRFLHCQPDPKGRSVSVYKDPRSPYWQFDFQWRGHRFHGSTKTTTRREAETVERAERETARQRVTQIEAARTSLRLDDIAGRWWSEVGAHLAGGGARNAWRELDRLIAFFGKDKPLTEITGGDVAKLVAWRRGHRGPNGPRLISPFTVNATTKALRKLFTRAK